MSNFAAHFIQQSRSELLETEFVVVWIFYLSNKLKLAAAGVFFSLLKMTVVIVITGYGFVRWRFFGAWKSIARRICDRLIYIVQFRLEFTKIH